MEGDVVMHFNCGVSVQRREKAKYGIRIVPYCDAVGELDELNDLKLYLLKSGIGSTLREGFLRVQGIQNCWMMTRFYPINDKKLDWWRTVVKMFSEKEHLTKAGMVKILELRPDNKGGGSRMTDEEILSYIGEP